MHEMGEMKRARELRVEEVSVQKLRENHETILQLTSQMQQVQEHMNSMNDSGDFQDVESNQSGRFSSHVSSQSLMITECSLFAPAATKDCRLTHGINLDYRKTFLEVNFLRLIHPEIILKRIQSDDVQRNREAAPEAGRTKTIHTSQDRNNQGTIPMPTFSTKAVDYEFYTAGGITAELHGRTAKTDKCRNCKSTNSVIHNHFCLENTTQNSSDYLF